MSGEDPLEGFEPMERPGMGRRSMYADLAEAFAESGSECLGKRVGRDAARRTALGVNHYAKRRGLPVSAHTQGDCIVLLRGEGGAR